MKRGLKHSLSKSLPTFSRIKVFPLAKIVFITSRFPYPLDKGDKLRVFFQLKHLSADHEIHLITISESEVTNVQLEKIKPFCTAIYTFKLPIYKRFFQMIISPFKGLPFQVAYFYNSKIKKRIHQLVGEIQPDIIHCHLIRTTEYVKEIKDVRKALDFMDAFGKGMERREKMERNPFKRCMFRYEKTKLYKYEEQIFDYMDRFCIISQQDKELINGIRKDEILTIPNGVDFEMFYPRKEQKIYDLVFMGNLGYPPNVHAIHFLVKEILPEIKKEYSNIRLLLAGSGAGTQIRNLQSDNVHLIGHFDNISDSIAMSKIMIAPMRISIGLQNKVIQAMAMGVPCVVSKITNNAIKAKHGKEIIEAVTAKEFANEIIGLLLNEKKANEIGEEGYRFVHENFSWERQNEIMNLLIITE
jgi:glycosyltransferase involved in cell wall biosynthesis